MALSKIQVSSMADNTIHGRRNLVINGAMQVAQRGTSFTSVSTSAYHLDRFRTGMGDTTARFTVTQATAGLNGFANSFKYDCTTAEASLANGNARLFFHTRLEGQDLQQIKKGTSDAEKVTVSFYVKSNKTGTYTLELNDLDNTRSNSQTYTISSSNTWERKIITFDADTTGAFDDDNALSLIIYWHLIAGTNYTSGTFNTSWATSTNANRVSSSQVNIGDSTDNTWEITGIQMEVGEQATPFEHRSFGEELALCQRYYEKSYNYGISPGTGSTDGWQGYDAPSGTSARFRLEFKTSKRGTPTMTTYHHSTGASGVMYTSSNGTQNTTVSGIGNNRAQVAMASGTLSSNAEVGCQWTADSEL